MEFKEIYTGWWLCSGCRIKIIIQYSEPWCCTNSFSGMYSRFMNILILFYLIPCTIIIIIIITPVCTMHCTLYSALLLWILLFQGCMFFKYVLSPHSCILFLGFYSLKLGNIRFLGQTKLSLGFKVSRRFKIFVLRCSIFCFCFIASKIIYT